MEEARRLPSPGWAAQSSGTPDQQQPPTPESQQAQQQQNGGRGAEQPPVLNTGRSSPVEVNDAERRRLKRRVANRESARRVREKRVEALSSTKSRLDQSKAQVKVLTEQLQQVEAKREIMLQRLAYVVREHRAMNEAMGDLGSPSPGPGADVMAIINGRQAQQRVPAVTSAAAAYIHPHVPLQSAVPPMTHPAAPAPLGPVLPLSMPQALPAPTAAVGRPADANGMGIGAAGPGGILGHISNLPTQQLHPGAPSARVSLPAGVAMAAQRLPARVTKSASSPGRFHGRTGSAPGGMSRSPDVDTGFHPAAVHRSQSTRIGMMNPSVRQNFASPPQPPQLPTNASMYGTWPAGQRAQPPLQGLPDASVPEELGGQNPQDLDMLRSLLLEGF
jgi:hypothetical protein